jgi:hypothetical protein
MATRPLYCSTSHPSAESLGDHVPVTIIRLDNSSGNDTQRVDAPCACSPFSPFDSTALFFSFIPSFLHIISICFAEYIGSTTSLSAHS